MKQIQEFLTTSYENSDEVDLCFMVSGLGEI